MNTILDVLWSRIWWTYETPISLSSHVYHWFNLFEAAAWIVFALLVFIRYLRHRHSLWEVAYACAFFLFGLTDVREAYALSSWLIWLKGLNLLALLLLRHMVLKRYYPESQLY